jgi:1-deoxy-D-xylulose-5-phosphate synthase
VAITGAMASSTGLLPFAERFPDRFFDVGIAEQHAVTFAAGLAMNGLRPVVCIYSTFLQRAFDQVTTDVALHDLPVLFVLDRAGVTGPDGASHHGMLDLSYLRTIPRMTVAAPSTPDEMRRMLATALAQDGPFALRYPRGVAPSGATAPLLPLTVPQVKVLQNGSDVALLGVGKMVGIAQDAAALLQEQGIGASVVDGRFVKPLDPSLAELSASHKLVVTVEDGTRIGGFGSAVAELFADKSVSTPLIRLGLPDDFLPHGSQGSLLHRFGLDAEGIAAVVTAALRADHGAILTG